MRKKYFELASLKEMAKERPYIIVAIIIIIIAGLVPYFYFSPAYENSTGSINLSIQYKNDTKYDLDNDGIENISGIIDFAIEYADINKEINQSSLLTRWAVHNLDEDRTTMICYGSAAACSFINLENLMPDWNSTFYLSYGMYGATHNNTVSAQIIYVDYSLDIENPYSNVFYSEWQSLPAVFEETPIINAPKINFSRAVKCKGCDSYVTPPNTEINMAISASGYFWNESLTEFYQNSWEIVEANTAQNLIADEKYNRLIWLMENSTELINVWYTIKSPEIIGEYSFITQLKNQSEIYLLNVSASNITHNEEEDQEFNLTLNAQPQLIKEIENITIYKNENYTLDLSYYFIDKDSWNLSYDYYRADNITVIIIDSFAEIIPDKEYTGIQYMFFTANDSHLSAVSNVFKVEVIEPMQNQTEELIQLPAEIDKPVKWIKKSRNKNISIPNEAYNLSITKVINDKRSAVSSSNIRIRIGGEIKDIEKFESEKLLIKEKKIKQSDKQNAEIIVNETADSLEVAFETEAPQKKERIISGKTKQITIFSNVSEHYLNVKAYTDILESQVKLRLYHITNNSRIDVTENPDYKVEFLDTNGNGLYDRIEWIVPHLSEQLFEIGLATINTKKSIYHPNEAAEIIMVVLDNGGHLVSNADVVLNITSPNNESTILSTKTGSIIQTIKGIYETSYNKTGAEGSYIMYVEAYANNVNNSMSSFFIVKDYYEFDIIRATPVTTDPWQGPFASSIKIISYTNTSTFNYSEVLPITFSIIDNNNSTIEIINNNKILTWKNLTNGSSVSYTALPPLITPELYEFQSYINYEYGRFEEARPWYLAVDPAAGQYDVRIRVYDTRENNNSVDDKNLLVQEQLGLDLDGARHYLGNVGALSIGTTYVAEMQIEIGEEYDLSASSRGESVVMADKRFASSNEAGVKEYLFKRDFAENNGTITDDIFISNFSKVDYNNSSKIGETGYVAGDLDIVTIIDGNNDINWFRNDGTPNLGPWNIYDANDSIGANTWYNDIELADIDNDGYMDIIYGDDDEDLVILRNPKSTGMWQTVEINNALGGDVNSIAAADFDNDGDLDIIAAVETINDIVIYEQSGDPWTAIGWTPRIQIDSDTQQLPYAIQAGDLNGDGDIDVASTMGGNLDYIVWYENDGSPFDGGWTERTVTDDSGEPYDLRLADFDNDGDLDIVHVDSGQDICIHENPGNGWLAPIGVNNIEAAAGGAIPKVAVGDIDGDGYVDIIVPVQTVFDIRWYKNPGATGDPFIDTWTYTNITVNTIVNPRCLAVGDIDFDSDLDVVIGTDDSAVDPTIFIRYFINDGTPTAEGWGYNVVSEDIGGGDGVVAVQIADIDNDANSNIISYHYNNSESLEQGVDSFDGYDVFNANQNYSFYFIIKPDDDFIEGDAGNMTFMLTDESHDDWVRIQEQIFGADIYPINFKWQWSMRNNTAPNVTNLSYPQDNFLTNLTIIDFNFTAVDDISPIDNCSLYTNFSGSWVLNRTIVDINNNSNINITLNNLPEGDYRWNIECEDSRNLKGSYSSNYTIILDYTHPSVMITNITPNPANHTLNNVTINWSASDIHLNSSYASVSYPNGTLLGVFNSSFILTTANLTVLGNYTVTAYANDSLGYKNSTTSYLIVQDVSAPEIILILPLNNSYSNNPILTVNYNVSDSSEISNCSLIIFYTVQMTNNTINKSATNSFTFGPLGGGVSYPWSVNCTDNSSSLNIGSSSTWTITIDIAPPALSLSSPGDNSWDSDGMVQMNYTPTDVNLDSCELWSNFSGQWQLNQTENNPDSGVMNNFSIVNLTEGSFIWNVWCNDSAGNSIWNSANYSVNIDKTPPIIGLALPVNGTWDTDGIVQFSYISIDANSAVCELWGNFSGQWAYNQTDDLPRDEENLFSELLNLTDGTYIWNVWCNDSAGNSAWNATNYTLNVDKTSPVVGLVEPQDNSWDNDGIVQFSYTSIDANSAVCELWGNFSGQWAYNQTDDLVRDEENLFSELLNLTDGTYIWNVKCNDSAGNSAWNATNYTENIDTTFPSISSEAINGSIFDVNQYICLNATVLDTFSGISFVRAQIKKPVSGILNITLLDDDNCGSVEGDDIYSALFLNDEGGEYNWTMTYAVDIAGNMNYTYPPSILNWSVTATNEINVTIESPIENIKINESDGNNNYTQICNVTCLSGSCNDVVLTAQYYNLAWNDIKTDTAQLINSLNNKSCGNLNQGDYCNQSFTITSGSNSGGNKWPVRCAASSSTAAVDYSNDFNITINDHPYANFTYPANGTWLHGIERINASSSMDDFDISFYVFELDNNSNFDSPESLCSSADENCTFDTNSQIQCNNESFSCYLRLNITDSDGLKNSTIITIGIDNHGPILIIGAPINGTNISASYYQLNASVTDLGIGINTTTFYYRENETEQWKYACNDSDGSTPFNCTWNLNGLIDGIYYQIRAYANDSFGNLGNNDTRYNITIDRAPPTIYLEQPINDSWSLNDVIIYYNVSDTYSNIANCSLILDGLINQTNNSIINEASLNFSLIDIPDGYHNWSINCSDTLGNQNASAARLIKIDNNGPAATLDRPPNYANISGSCRINTSVNDNNGIGVNHTLFYYRENETEQWAIICNTSTAPYNCTWQTNLLNEGNYYEVKAYANDSLGNYGDNSTHYNITIDRTPPAVYLESPQNNTQDVGGDDIFFTYNVTDVLLGISNCSLILNGTVNQTNMTIIENVLQNFSLSGIANGNYSWQINCTDSAGNKNGSGVRKLIIAPDTVAPVVALISPEDAYIDTDGTIIFEYNVTDILSDIANCSLIINQVANQINSTAVIQNQINNFTLDGMQNGQYNWSINCTDRAAAPNTGNSSIRNLTVMITTKIITNITSDYGEYEIGEIASYNTTTKDEYANNLDSSLSIDLIKGNTTVYWWNASWARRKAIFINETAGRARNNIRVEVNLTGLGGNISSCVNEIRVVKHNSSTPITVNILDGDNTDYCRFVFLANVSASAVHENLYYVYYNNSQAVNPGYGTLFSTHHLMYEDFEGAGKGWYQVADSVCDAITCAGNSPWGDYTYCVDVVGDTSDICVDGISNGNPYEGSYSLLIEDGAPNPLPNTGLGYDFNTINGCGNTECTDINVQFASVGYSIDSGESCYVWAIDSSAQTTPKVIYNCTSSQACEIQTGRPTSQTEWNYTNLNLSLKNVNMNASQINISFSQDASAADDECWFDVVNISGIIGIAQNVSISLGTEERLIERVSTTTGEDGAYNFSWDTYGKESGNYSGIARAVKTLYEDGIDYTWFVIVPDISYPSIQLNSPENGTWTSLTSIAFYYTPSDNSFHLANCSLIINENVNQTNNSIINLQMGNFTIGSIVDGHYNWSVNCTDAAGNANGSVIRVLHIDTLYPSISYAGGMEQNNSFVSRNWIYMNVSANDANEANITFYLFNSSFSNINTTTMPAGTRSINFTNLADGRYYFNVSVRDYMNYTNSTSLMTIFLDTNNPSINFSGGTEANGSYFNRDWIFVNATTYDLNEANITFYLFNSSFDAVNTTTLGRGNRSINFSSLNQNMIYYYNLTVQDYANNRNATVTRKLTLDSVYPSVDFAGGTAENNSIFNRNWIYINVTGYDLNEANITFYLYNSSYNNINTTTLGAGNRSINFTNLNSNMVYYYNVSLLDKALNRNSTFARNIALDSTNPSVSLDEPFNSSWDNDGSILFTYTMIDSNIQACILYHNASGWQPNETNNSVVSGQQDVISFNFTDGTYLWNVRCNDSAGNSAFNTTNFTFSVDTVKPTIDFAGGTFENNSFDDRNWIYVNLTANDTNEANITFYLYNSSLHNVNATSLGRGNRSINFTSVADGIYYYNSTIEDYANNKNYTSTRRIIVDTTYPSIEFSGLTASNNSFFNREWIYINISIIEANEANITFYLFNSSFENLNSTTLGAGNRSINFTQLNSNGVYYYNVTVRDTVNHENSTVFRKITLDSLYPSIEFISPTPLNDTNQTSISVVINVSHFEANPNTILFYWNNSINQSRQYSGNYTNFTLNNIADGAYVYYVRLNDSAANYNQTQTRIVRIDTTPPIINLISPLNNTWRNNATNNVLFEYNATDITLAIANCSLVINGDINKTNMSVIESRRQNFSESLQGGYYNWSINCSDSLGNSNNSESRLLKVDLTFPTITNQNINDTNLSITEYICLNATVTDSGSGVNSTRASILPPNNIPETVLLYRNITTSCDQSNSDDVYSAEYRVTQLGTYNWPYTYSNDTAGNLNFTTIGLSWNSTSVGTMTVNLTYPTQNIEINESEVSMNYSYTQNCTVKCDDSPQNCTDVYLYAQYNLSGATDITKSTNYLINNNDSYFCGNLTAGTGVCNYSFIIKSSLNSGQTSWKVWCRAESAILGIYSSIENINITINDHPYANFTYPANGTWLSSIERFNASLSYDDQDISLYSFELDNTSNFNSPSLLCSTSDENCTFDTTTQIQCNNESNSCYLRLNITDTDGLKNSTSLQIRIDNLAPRLSLNSPANGSWDSDGGIIFNYLSTDVNIDSCILYHNASGWQANETNSSIVSGQQDVIALNFTDNSYIWNVWCNDTENNSGFNAANYTFNVDTIKPTMEFAGGTENNNTFFNRNWIFLNISAYDLNEANITFYLFNSSLQNINTTTLGMGNRSINFTNLNSNMVYYYNATIRDKALNENSTQTRKITLDSAGPIAVLDMPRNFTNISASYYIINASVSDSGIGVNSTIFLYRENETESWKNACNDTDGNPPYNCSWNLNGLPDGAYYQIRVYANDSLGIFGNNDTHTNITLDRVTPHVTLVQPENNTRSLNGTAVFIYNVTDITSSIASCSLIFNGRVNETNFSVIRGINLNFTKANLPEAQYNWSINCTDSAGNVNSSEIRNLTVASDRDAPIITLISPDHNSQYTSEDIVFSYNVTDAISDIANCSLVFNGQLNQTNSSGGLEGQVNRVYLYNIPDGTYTWGVNCTDTSQGYYNKGNSSTYTLNVFKTTTLNVNLSLDKAEYGLGELGYFTVNVTDLFSNALDASVYTQIIMANTTLPWWDTSYNYRKMLNITNNGTKTILTSYTLNYTLSTLALINDSKMLANGSDLRVAWFNNITKAWVELDRLVYNINTTATSILFRTQDILPVNASDLRYYVYYGSSNAGIAPQNISNIYFFYDLFDGNTLSGYTKTRAFSDSAEDSDASLSYDAANKWIAYSTNTSSSKGKSLRKDLVIDDIIIETDEYVADWIGAGGRLELGVRVNGNINYYMAISTNILENSKLMRNNGTDNVQLAASSYYDSTEGVWHRLKLIVFNNASGVVLRGFVDDNNILNYTDASSSNISTEGGFGVGAYRFSGRFDNITIKRYYQREPLIFNGIEEQLISYNSSTTGLDGIWIWEYNTLGLNYTWYSMVASASKTNYFNDYDFKNFEIVSDTRPPIIQLNLVDYYNTSLTYINFNWTATDAVLTSNITCNLTVDGAVNKSQLNLTNGQAINYTPYGFSQGIHYWNVTCWDNKNNSNTSNTRMFTVDLTEPSIILNEPINSYNTSRRWVLFNFTAQDNLFTRLNCSLYINNILNQTNSSVINGSNTYFNVTNFADGRYYWNISCFDLVSNQNWSATRDFLIDTRGPSFSNLILSPSIVHNSDNLTIYVNITDNLTIDTVLIEGNWTGQFVNYTMSSYYGSGNNRQYNYTINSENFTSGEFISYRFYANDTLGNLNYSSRYNFTVARSFANITITYPIYEINRYINETFWLNATISALNGSIKGCNVTVNYTSGLTLLSTITQNISNLTHGSSNSTPAWLFNGTSPGDYFINITSDCFEGDGRTARSVNIEITDVYYNLSEESYVERKIIDNITYYHISSETGYDWWTNGSEEYVSTNSTGVGDIWFKYKWYIIVNDTFVYDFVNLTWDVQRAVIDELDNSTIIQYIGRLSEHNLRINYTKRAFSYSSKDNISFSITNLGNSNLSDIKLKWSLKEFDIYNNNWVDNLTMQNSSGQMKSYYMNSSTSLNFNQSRFGTPEVYFVDENSIIRGYAYWEWTMSTNGAKSNLYNFSFNAGGQDFIMNFTFGLGNLTAGQVKGLDPGAGLWTPGLIRRTADIANLAASEAGTTYTDVTSALTDNNLGTTSYAVARSGDQVRVLNILNNSEISNFDSVYLRLYPTSIEADPYPTVVYAYSANNVTVDTTRTSNYTFRAGGMNSWIQINITSAAHLQDGYGYLRIRFAPNASAIANFNRIYLAEIRINVTDETGPGITLNYPLNDFNTTNSNITFNWTAIDRVDNNLSCNLTIDGMVNTTNIVSLGNISVNATITGFSEGVHYWNVTCWDDYSNKNTSNTRYFTIIDEPKNISISIVQNSQNIMLNWSNKSYPASYAVYISNDYAVGFSDIPNVNGILTNNWTDTAASSYEKRFYKVATVKGSANKTSTATVGKYSANLIKRADQTNDWNLISIPFNISNWELFNGTNDGTNPSVNPENCIRSVYRYNLSNGWERTDYNGTAWIRAAPGNFTALEPGRSYWFEVNESCNLTFVGEVPINNINLTLSQGWNIMGWYSPNISNFPMTSEATGWSQPEPPSWPINVTPDGAVFAIDRYNASIGEFEVTYHYSDNWGWWPSSNNPGFTTIDPTVGYYFDTTPSAVWMHDPNT